MQKTVINNSDFKQTFKKIKVVLLDLDGTVYLGDNPIDGAKQALEFFRAAGKKLVFLTNNSSKTDEEYVKKLGGMNLYRAEDDVYTSGDATAEYLNKNFPGKRVYLLAPEKVKQSFINHGVTLCETGAEVAVLAYDTTLNFEKITRFDAFLKSGARYIATHPDAVCPAPEYSVPDVGSFIEMFRMSSGRTPDEIIGKPNTVMGDMVKLKYSAKSDEIMMVGDRMYTDIRFALNNGFYSMAVLSGETTKEQYLSGDIKASFVFDSLGACIKSLV